MAKKNISKDIDIIEHASTSRGTVKLRRNNEGNYEAVIGVELTDTSAETYRISASKLSDGSTVLTSQEFTDLEAILLKVYNHGRDNIPGSTP